VSNWVLSDPMGSVISELRTANVASGRVRGNEPAPATANYEGDASKPYKRFVVIVDLGGPRMHRAPIQTLRYALRCYGTTYQDARDLYGDCSDVLDNAGPRYSATGVAIHQTLDDTGGSAQSDPVTGQPYYEGIFEVFAGAHALAS
jgi:hypothetical protein